jgi:23S rRNA (uridine2552-2'-O)-methyltransferase
VLKEKKSEHYYLRAKREGYRSRSAYKLLHISERFNLIRKGEVVIDLGCAPGGWMQVSRQLVGEQGYVLGVDKRPIEKIKENNTGFIAADVTDLETVDLVVEVLPRKADVLLSDLAPNVTGIWQIDHLRQIDLARTALSMAKRILKPNGKFITKAFQGESLNQFVEELRGQFLNVRIIRPPATRKRSAEVYLLATGFLGG